MPSFVNYEHSGGDSVDLPGSLSCYEARMVYLVDDDDQNSAYGTSSITDPMSRSLKPPNIFMTRRQARLEAVLSARGSHTSGGTKGGDQLRCVRVQEKPLATRRNDASNRTSMRRSDRRQQLEDHEDEDKPTSWRQVKEAGVVFWVNDITGFATDECPHASLAPLTPKGNELSGGGGLPGGDNRAFQHGLGEGTGALVYDDTEFKEAMRILDGKGTRSLGT
ncbi:unnamed protein product [Discosporangium mesarthrocarpum]